MEQAAQLDLFFNTPYLDANSNIVSYATRLYALNMNKKLHQLLMIPGCSYLIILFAILSTNLLESDHETNETICLPMHLYLDVKA